MKCIGLFKGLLSSTSVVNMYGNTYFKCTISIENALRFNLVLFKFQNFPLSTFLIILTCTYSVLCNCERGASCTWLFVPTKLFHSQNALQSHTYNLKAVYKISAGRKYYEFYVEMSPNCSILASIFKIFLGGHAPRPPLVPACKLCTPLPNLELAPPFYKS